MARATQRSILLVDNQKYMRETMAVLLDMEGYRVSTATHGLDALHRLELAAPDLIISDLTPPHWVALEFLSVVRRQFPCIPVIALSAADDSGSPVDTMADAFYSKEQCRVDELFRTVAAMIYSPVTRPAGREAQSARARIRLTTDDSAGTPLFLLTCTACRLSFSSSIAHIGPEGIEQTPCPFCTAGVRYDDEVSLPIAS